MVEKKRRTDGNHTIRQYTKRKSSTTNANRTLPNTGKYYLPQSALGSTIIAKTNKSFKYYTLLAASSFWEAG
jgi:hypothetical protein